MKPNTGFRRRITECIIDSSCCRFESSRACSCCCRSRPAPRAAQQVATPEAGITGLVLTPDGAPVTQGNVTLMTSMTSRVNAAIDRSGHFRLLPDGQGSKRLFISVPGLAPYRANLNVPSSRTMALPDITLQEATYFHARFVTTESEPLPAAGLRKRSIDRDGLTITDPLDHVREQIEPDGSITIGPLPAGRMMMAFDRQPLAQTRLRDIDVNGTKKLIEGGTIPIAPGAQLHVEIVDGAGEAGPAARRVDRGCGPAVTAVVSTGEDQRAGTRGLRSPCGGPLSRVDAKRSTVAGAAS